MSYAPDAPEEAATRVYQELRSDTLIAHPNAYIVAPERESSADDNALFTLGFAQGAAQADAKSRVYHADAKRFSSAVRSTEPIKEESVDDEDVQNGVQLTITSPPYLEL